MNTKLLVKKIIESGDLFRDDAYSLKQLFEIRDSLYILDKYNLADIDLLREVEKHIAQNIGE